MATSENIRIDAQLLAGVQMDKATVFRLICEQLPIIVGQYFRAGKYIKEHFETTNHYEIYVPKKPLVLIDRMINEHYVQTVDYNTTNDGIVMFKPGKYTLLYFAQPELPQSEFHEIDIPVMYAAAFKFYIAARYRARMFGQTDDSAVSLYKEYTTALETADKAMDRR